MRKLFFILAGILFLTGHIIAQQVLILPVTAPAGIPGMTIMDDPESHGSSKPDSTTLVRSLSLNPLCSERGNLSVYDYCWVTDCIKGGWKSTDTTMVGLGVEECDTAYPFVMPVVGKLWRGCSSYHAGWDIGLNYKDPVVAGMNGRVRYARYCSGYGNLVIIRHYSGLEIYYAHLSKILVSANQDIEPGDTIGLGGATGRARGYHLHMEFRLRDRALNIADFYTQNDTTVNLFKIFHLPPPPAKPQGTDYYTIVKGDNLSRIASRYGTTVNSLCALNNISRTTTLRIGQRLRIR